MDQEFKISAVNTPKETRGDGNKDKKKIPKKNQEELLCVKKVSNKIKNIVDGINGRTDTAKEQIVSWKIGLRNSSRMWQKRIRQERKKIL